MLMNVNVYCALIDAKNLFYFVTISNNDNKKADLNFFVPNYINAVLQVETASNRLHANIGLFTFY